MLYEGTEGGKENCEAEVKGDCRVLLGVRRERYIV